MEEKVKELEKTILSLSAQVSSLAGDVTTNTQGLASTDSEVSNLAGEINTIKNKKS